MSIMFKLINRQKKISTNQIVQDDSDDDIGANASSSPAKLALVTEKPSIISAGCTIEGGIHSDGILLLEGSVNGAIESQALTVGKSGRIRGNVACKVLHIKGFYSGEAVCDELVIDETAVIEASISYKRIKIERGAVIVGTLSQGIVKSLKVKRAAA